MTRLLFTADPSHFSILLRLVCALSLLASLAQALTCDHPCNTAYCGPLSPDACPHGIVKDPCGCCDVCAKGLNEICGGSFNLEGRCGHGLICKVNTTIGIPGLPGRCERNATAITNDSGTDCGNSSSTEQPPPVTEESCREKCTPQFCGTESNKARICSARGVEFEFISDRDSCQHTSCHACYLLVRPSCDHLRCPAHANKRCLRMFLTCIGDHYFTSLSEDKLLRLDDPRAQLAEGRITCHIPNVEDESPL